MIAPAAGLSISRQCTLLGLARSSFYYRPRAERAEELELLKRLDRIFTDCPVYGSRRLRPLVLPTNPIMELMLTIDPPPVFAICSAASFVPRNTLVWLTAMMRCQRRNAIP